MHSSLQSTTKPLMWLTPTTSKPVIHLGQLQNLLSRWCLRTLARIPTPAAEAIIFECVVTEDETYIEEATAIAAHVAQLRAQLASPTLQLA